MFKNMLPVAQANCKNFIIVKDIITSIFYIYAAQSHLKLAVASSVVFDILSRHLVDTDLYSKMKGAMEPLLDRCMHIFSVEVKLQNGVEDLSIFGSLMLTLFSGLFLNRLPSKDATNTIINKMGHFGKSVQGIDSMLTIFAKCIKYVCCELRYMWSGVPSSVDEIDNLCTGLSTWYKEVCAMLTIESQNGVTGNPDLCLKIEHLFLQGLDFSLDLDRARIPPAQRTSFMLIWNQLSKLYAKVDNSGAFNNGPRNEPFFLFLFGKSCIGKSYLTAYLAILILRKAGYDENTIGRNIYMWNPGQKHWDGYENQYITVMDDFAAAVDSLSNPNEDYYEIIRMANIVTYNLSMAEIEKKAKTKFSSKLVILNGNTINFPITSLSCEEAVRRRFDLCFEVTIKPAYQKENSGHLDFSLLDHDNFDPSCYEFKQWDAVKIFPVTGIVYNFEEFLTIFTKAMDVKHARSDVNVERLKGAIMDNRYDNFLGIKGKRIEIVEKPNIFNELLEKASYREKPPSLPMGEMLSKLLFKQPEEKDNVNFLFKQSDTEEYHDACDAEHIEAFNSSTRYRRYNRHKCVSYDAYGICACNNVEYDPGVFEYTNHYFKTKSGMVLMSVKDYIQQMSPDTNSWYKKFNLKLCCVTDYLLDVKNNILNNPAIILETLETALNLFLATCTLYTGYNYLVKPIIDTYKSHQKESFPKDMTLDWNDEEITNDQYEHCNLEHVSGDNTTKYKTRVKFEHVSNDATTKHNRRIKFEASSDKNTTELINSKIFRNQCRMEIFYDTFVDKVNILFVRGRTAITVNHAVSKLHSAVMVRVTHFDNSVIEINNPKTILIKQMQSRGEDIDASLIAFPKIMHSHSNIVKHFMMKEDYAYFKTCFALLPVVRYMDGKIIPNTMSANVKAIDLNTKIEGVMVRNMFEYSIPTQAGDCGSPLMVMMSSLSHKILGIHQSGGVDTHGRMLSYAIPIVQQDIEDTFKSIPKDMQILWEFERLPLVSYQTDNMLQGNFVALGQVDKPLGGSTKTTIRPSFLHNLIVEPKTAPSVLFPRLVNGVMINPKLESLKKAGKKQVYIDEDLVSYCTDHIFTKFRSSCDKSILDYKQAVSGVEDNQYIHGICRKTSPGYPYILNRKGKGKEAYFGKDIWLYDPEIEKDVLDLVNDAKQNIRTPVFCVDTLKDERRTLEKVAIARTRTMCNLPMNYTIAFRQYFSRFVANIMENRIDNEIAIGINPANLEWQYLFNYLQGKGNKIVCGDYHDYDGSLSAIILRTICDKINEWYDDGEENATVRNVLFESIVNSFHITDNNVHMWKQSQPSGNPLTTVLNSIYNSVIMRMCYMDLSPYKSLKDFDLKVNMISFGDDNVLNISDSAIEYFNQNTIATSCLKYGMIYTNEMKTEISDDFRTIFDISFLQRSFRRDDTLGRVVAPLKLDTILEMVMWIHGDVDIIELCLTNVENALRELVYHGEEIFTMWSKKIREAIFLKLGKDYYIDPYLQYARYIDGLTCVTSLHDKMDSLQKCEGNVGLMLTENKPRMVLYLQKDTGWLFNHNGRVCACINKSYSPSLYYYSCKGNQRYSEFKTSNKDTDNTNAEVVQQEQTTTFFDDVSVAREEVENPVVTRPHLGMDRIHNIQDTLERPVLLKSATFATSHVQNVDMNMTPVAQVEVTQPIEKLNLPNALFSNPLISQKLNYFKWMRGDIGIRVVVNAQPFISGKFLLVYSPNEDNLWDRGLKFSGATSITSYPHVELDICGGNSAEITIPFADAVECYDMQDLKNHMGTFSLYVLSPMRSGMTQTISYSIYGWFKNPQYCMPSGRNNAYISLQSGRESYTAAKSGVITQYSHPISKMLSSLSHTPLLGSYVRPLAWSMEVVNKMASAFGWSKPNNVSIPMTITNISAKGFTNVDGVDNGVTLGFGVNNSLQVPVNAFATNVDEMDINYICSKPGMNFRFPWNVADGLITLARIPVGMGNIPIKGTTQKFYYPTLGQYVANRFYYWRGSVRFRFSFTKTDYHTGRLLFQYTPNNEAGLALPAPMQNTCYSQILDLKESSELTMEIPFTSNKLWLPTSFDDINSNMGTIYVSVLNRLSATDTVAPIVPCLVWMSFGDDFRVARPNDSNYKPAVVLVSGAKLASDEETPIVEESDFLKLQSDTISSGILGNDNFTPLFGPNAIGNQEAEESCIGDSITSVRTAIKRFSEYVSLVGQTYSISADYFPVAFYTGAAWERTGCDNLAYFGAIYRFYRGSMRYKFFCNQNDNLGPVRTSLQYATTGNPPTVGPGASWFAKGSWPQHVSHTHHNNFHEVTVPFYRNTRIVPMGGQVGTIAPYLQFETRVSSMHTVLRAAGDDLSFGWLVGPPPLVFG
jgi:hypothetical protein